MSDPTARRSKTSQTKSEMTSQLLEIEPKYPLRLMDLVEAAGIDVAPWADCAGGATYAARNPKFCYEWSFVNPEKVVVLNVWHELMEESPTGVLTRKFNMRDFASKRKGPEKRRAMAMNDAIRLAFEHHVPVRVIVLGGRRRNINNPDEKPSKVKKRLLDPVAWHVAAYERDTGDCILMRGGNQFVDQFSIHDIAPIAPEKREVLGSAFIRDPLVRGRVLVRANGRCELCNVLGFLMADGGIYLETHHVIPLSEGGPDIDSNVAALCPNHHREAHFGKMRNEMRQELLQRLATFAVKVQ